MDALQAFLDSNLDITKEVELPRLKTSLVLKALDGKTISALNSQATQGGELDEHFFGALAVAKSCTNVDFGSAEMKAKFKASDPGDCVQKALLAGEIAKITKEVMSVSGFEDINAQVEKAKN